MRLVQSLIWLRTQPGDPAQAFEQRPADLRSQAHEMRLEGDRLRLRQLDAGRGDWWDIPYRTAAVPDGG